MMRSLGVKRWGCVCVVSLLCMFSTDAMAKAKRVAARRSTKSVSPAAKSPTVTPPAPVAPSVTPAHASKTEAAKNDQNVVQRESKIEFDERLVQGQTASGAIYLFERGASEFLSMVHIPSSFREKTLAKIFAERNQEASSGR